MGRCASLHFVLKMDKAKYLKSGNELVEFEKINGENVSVSKIQLWHFEKLKKVADDWFLCLDWALMSLKEDFCGSWHGVSKMLGFS